MFKKLVPVIALALIAGPVFAADAPPADTSAAAPAAPAKSHKKHHGKKHTKAATSETTAPAK